MNNVPLILAVLLSPLSLFGQGESVHSEFKEYANDTLSATDPRLKESPTKSFTSEEVLNRTIPWSNPYKQDIVSQANGIDASKAGKIPNQGVHPRIFTSPSDFADIKRRLETTQIGKQLTKLAHKELEAMRRGEGAAGKAYMALKSAEKPAENVGELPKELPNLLAIQGLLAQLDNNSGLLAETASLAARYLKTDLKRIADLAPVLGREEMVKEEVISGAELAKLFDFTASGMSASDRAEIVGLFAKNTSGRYSAGMELPHHWRRWNHIPASSQFGLTVLAIENEPGYDKRIYDCAADVAADYLTYAFNREGMSSEGICYTFGPFEHQLLFMAAMARRGNTSLFANTHFRAIPDWLIYSLAPNPECLWSSHGDTGSTAEVPWTMMMAMKYFFPNDSRIDYLFANSVERKPKKLPDVSAFVFCCDPDRTAAQYGGVPPAKMPLTYFSPGRGSFITRDRWDKNGVMFQFDARQDTYYQSHDHGDRGNFELAANGRNWVMDGWRSTESKYHSVITIDGHGQGYFATPAAWKNYIDTPEATFGLVDYKYAFDWKWLKSPVSDAMLGRPLAPKYREGVYVNTAKNLMRYFPGQLPERDPLRKVAEYFSGCLETNPLIWTEDTWPMRMPNYPVEYAFRTAGLVRGKHPYMLIVDDLKKDSSERLYEWAMPVQLDVEVVSIKQLMDLTMEKGPLNLGFNSFANRGVQGEYDVILGDKQMKRDMSPVEKNAGGIYSTGRFTPEKGNPQLLVRVLERTAADVPNMEPNPRLETFENIKTEDMHQFYLRTMGLAKRLVIPSRSTSPNFKILLFPYLHGEELPQTQWNENRTQLTVSFSDQKDVFTFEKGNDSHTKTKLVRDGKTIFEF